MLLSVQVFCRKRFMALAVAIESRISMQDYLNDYRLMKEIMGRLGATEPLLLKADDD